MHLFSDTASGRIASLPSPTDTLPNVQGKRMMSHTRHTRSPQPGDLMPNPSAVLYIALPHLHPALVEQDARRLGLALPEGVRSLWPGLPAMPEGTFAPETLPWSPSQASVCLADFERNIRDGARGMALAPLAARDIYPAGPMIGPEEEAALLRLNAGTAPSREMEQTPNLQQLRESAQRTLILAWLQERQALEMAELERSVAQGKQTLAGLLGDGSPSHAEQSEPTTPSTPKGVWRAILDAALTLLEPEPSRNGLRLLILDEDMSDALKQKDLHLPPPEGESPPPGFAFLTLPQSALSASPQSGDKTLIFLCPATGA